MPKITYGDNAYDCDELQTVLDCLVENGLPVPHSCRSGACCSCMMRAVKGKVPKMAQKNLDMAQAAKNYFLPCSCYPESDMEVVLDEARA